jgi:hypothetical protein
MMLERKLTQLLGVAVRRAAGQRSIPWAIVVVGAYLLRRALRDADDVETVTVRRGKTVSVSVVNQEG